MQSLIHALIFNNNFDQDQQSIICMHTKKKHNIKTYHLQHIWASPDPHHYHIQDHQDSHGQGW